MHADRFVDVAEAVAVERLQHHHPRAPPHAADAVAVVAHRADDPGHVRAVAIDGLVLGSAVETGRVDAVHVVDPGVPVVVDPVSGDLARIAPEVRGEVEVGELRPGVDDRDDDVAAVGEAGCVRPGGIDVDVMAIHRVVQPGLQREVRVVRQVIARLQARDAQHRVPFRDVHPWVRLQPLEGRGDLPVRRQRQPPVAVAEGRLAGDAACRDRHRMPDVVRPGPAQPEQQVARHEPVVRSRRRSRWTGVGRQNRRRRRDRRGRPLAVRCGLGRDAGRDGHHERQGAGGETARREGLHGTVLLGVARRTAASRRPFSARNAPVHEPARPDPAGHSSADRFPPGPSSRRRRSPSVDSTTVVAPVASAVSSVSSDLRKA